MDQLSRRQSQKIILGRWLYAGAEIFILDEPAQVVIVGRRRYFG